MEQRDERLPLPSEDDGDLVAEPPTGMTDDYLVATEEGVPWDPPSERVLSEARVSESGADVAGTDPDPGGELGRDPAVQPGDTEAPRDDGLLAACIEALRASDVVAGDRIRLAVSGTTVLVQGEVESIDVLDEVLAIVGDVPGVTDVVDEVTVAGI